MRICIVRLSALGDLVMCLPLIASLKKTFPKAEITWIIDQNFYPLFKNIEGIEILPLKKIKTLANFLNIRKMLKEKTFDILLGCQASMSANLLYPLIQAKRKIGYDKQRSRDFHTFFMNESILFKKNHTVEGFLQFAEKLGVQSFEYKLDLNLSAADLNFAKAFKAPYFLMCPFSSKEGKNWSLENYEELILDLQSRTLLEPIFIGGPKDYEKIKPLADKLNIKNLAGKTTLSQLAALIQDAEFLISPDTGPMHIASFMGTKVIALFAATSPILTGPYFERKYVIDKHLEALEKFGGKSEKKLGWNVRVYHEGAMKLISISDVQAQIACLLKK
jgi:heptosyltransferase I